ncbi:MAG: ChbG/HpnK family deacetylase [Endozoicomonas sp. (ex Botrylloides leachii)]|nr:ChbG/HpnK family deacetylase [Endozoicomonas sp. (ex Botrylloides leachii)]
MKRITLCADDYAITSSVSQAILSLADQGAIQATSCMVTMPAWQKQAVNLQAYTHKLALGLHLNFTEGAGLTPYFKQGFPSLYSVLVKSHLRLFSQAKLVEEVNAQIIAFADATGRLPDFIDGHQHIHHLPQIRQALLSVMQSIDLPKSTTWIRSVSPLITPNNSLKHCIIEHSGARALRQLLNETHFKTNAAFAGVYSLSPHEAFRTLVQYWLNMLPDKGLIMCHPGFFGKTQKENETIEHEQARQNEYDYLSSSLFVDDCRSAGVELSASQL